MGDPKGGITIRIPKATIVAIALAIAGFGWNKVESYLDRDTQHEVGKGVFSHFQGQIDELRDALATLEEACLEEEPIAKAVGVGGGVGERPRFPVSSIPIPVMKPDKPIPRQIAYDDIFQQVQQTGEADLEEIMEAAAGEEP